MTDQYDDDFMSYADVSSTESARIVTQSLQPILGLSSVLDVGCARGTWLEAWRQRGVVDCLGIDGDYVDQETLLIKPSQFLAADLSQRVRLDRRFDLVQSLEVGEHLPRSASERFVRNLTEHSRGLILFSAAPPGQGGEFHRNEQPYEFWRRLFGKQGFIAHDPLRPLLKEQHQVSFWYRFNTLLYVHREALSRLPTQIAATRIPDEQPIPDVSPAVFRLRKLLVRGLPGPVQNLLARFKSRLMRTGRF